MIEEVRIRGLGVIEDAVLPLGPGLTAVTGETGAGKTMLLTGLALILGDRADPGAVRPGCERAEVEARVRVDGGGRVAARVREAGGDVDEDEVLLARVVPAQGRARALAGGRTVPTGVLAEIGDDLVAVHGQGESRWLTRPSRQREVLDRSGGPGLADALARYAEGYGRLRAAEAQAAAIRQRRRARADEAGTLRLALGHIERIAPLPGEDLDLAAEAERLRHAETLRESADAARQALAADMDGGDEIDVIGLVARARKGIDLARQHDPRLDEPAARLGELAALAADLAQELASYAAGVDTDRGRLDWVEERRAALGELTRRDGGTVDDVLAWAEGARDRLAALEAEEDEGDRLGAQAAALRAELAPLAAEVSARRQGAGQAFADAVAAELAGLAMPHARVRFVVRQRVVADGEDGLAVAGPAGEARRVAFGPTGVDEVELLLSPHPGAPEQPVARAASGGEISRVMLAVQVVLAGSDPVPTFVFDEVDAGVGGRAAVEVGRRLARLGRTAQVLVVTHLPQVAAFADAHVLVRKSDDGVVTAASVDVLTAAERVREVARMLAGQEDSRVAADHAAELLELAARERAAAQPPQCDQP